MVNRTEATNFARNLFEELVDYGMDRTNPAGSICHLDLPNDITWACGASRIAIWRNNSNYVIKMPIYANCLKYCEREVEIYHDAVKQGIEEYFAWCDCAIAPADNGGFGVYVMEFLNCDEDGIDDDSMEYRFKEYCRSNDLDSEDEEVRDDFLDWYWDSDDCGDAVIDYLVEQIPETSVQRKVYSFIDNEDISDIHSGNVGYRNNTLVFCDYASYGW